LRFSLDRQPRGKSGANACYGLSRTFSAGRYAHAVNLAERLQVPDDARALLVDLDGVLLDTLTMEYELMGELLGRPIERSVVRAAFPHPIPEAWRRILVAVGIDPDPALIAKLGAELEAERGRRAFTVHEGIREVLAAAREAGLHIAVVSNNPANQIADLLERAGLAFAFDAVVGNDRPGVRSKPAPDPYLAGAAAVGAAPAACVAIEDSLVGAASAATAGCHVIGVATGAARFAELSASPQVDRAYETFGVPACELSVGDVTNKRIVTPNEFVSHMVEHVAWRLGCALRLAWHSDDWRALGELLGTNVAPLLDGSDQGAALGMIDDGSAEVRIERAATPTVALVGLTVDPDWFAGLRCEQLADGRPLVELLHGLAKAAGLDVRVDIAAVEDPHHTWEAIWRGIGVALRGLSRTLTDAAAGTGTGDPSRNGRTNSAYGFPAGIDVALDGSDAVTVSRTTAETRCEVELALGGPTLDCRIETSEAVDSHGLAPLVQALADHAGIGGSISFSALELSSSHVVAEDIGMTLGAALKVLAIERMNAHGIEGAGSSLHAGRQPRPIRVGMSFEGRKFLKFVPIGWDYGELRGQLIGRTLQSGLFSEDLDDFLDGLAGGMACSIVVHWERLQDPDLAWRLVFEGAGAAIAGLLQRNATRHGLIAGVKASLA
jgi:HAD superfamily hydrolase (TIGR01509 family)